jgi:hypothetical protein
VPVLATNSTNIDKPNEHDINIYKYHNCCRLRSWR